MSDHISECECQEVESPKGPDEPAACSASARSPGWPLGVFYHKMAKMSAVERNMFAARFEKECEDWRKMPTRI